MWRLSLIAVVAVACGGVVEGGSSQGGGSEQPSASGGKQPTPPDAAGDGAEDPNADTELGECELGFRETYDRACGWVGDGRCYETRQMACNCVCPRNRDSQCASGFGSGPDGHVWVACR